MADSNLDGLSYLNSFFFEDKEVELTEEQLISICELNDNPGFRLLMDSLDKSIESGVLKISTYKDANTLNHSAHRVSAILFIKKMLTSSMQNARKQLSRKREAPTTTIGVEAE
jgi:hypothetical protein